MNHLPDSDHHVRRMLNKAMIELGLGKNYRNIGRAEISQFAHNMGVYISQLQATEIILRARGEKMEKSDTCNFDEIVNWFRQNLATLRPKRNLHTSINLTR